MLFFAQAESRRAMWSVTAGRYIGVGIVVLISFLGAGMLHSVPENYIRFLGVYSGKKAVGSADTERFSFEI